MGASAFNTRPELPWTDGSPAAGRSYLVAGMRAALIAVALLGVLALVVLF